jgi:adenine-specific DNA-methyltransferase
VSTLTELINRVQQRDPDLARELAAQVKSLMDLREFGLNFERHVPETVELPGRRVRRGDKVRFLPPRGKADETVDDRLWTVQRIGRTGDTRTARLVEYKAVEEPQTTERCIEDLVVVAEFRDSIYPGLESVEKIERGGDEPFHTVINAENFHALQALRFAYEGVVDAIYIDPPYNTRDKGGASCHRVEPEQT